MVTKHYLKIDFAEQPALREKERVTSHFSFFFTWWEGSETHSRSFTQSKKHSLLLRCFQWPLPLLFLPFVAAHSLLPS